MRRMKALCYLHFLLLQSTMGKYIPSYTPTVAESTNNFAHAVYKTFPSTKNIVFSPWSVAFSLGMVMLGSGGKTLQELKDVMFLSNIEPESIHYGFKQLREHLMHRNENYEMKMFSTILIEENHNISPLYKLRLQRYYDAHIHDTSFSKHGELVTEWINSWTSLQTGGKVKGIMSTVPDPDTIMLLLTANYFKGKWEETFDANQTRPGTFTNHNGETADVEMMFAMRNMTVYSGDDLAVEAIDIPMKGDISFLFVMPESPREFQVLQKNISAEFLNTLRSGMSKEPVQLFIPKFKASSREELQQPLQQMGVEKLFSYTNADLSGISNQGGLAVQEIIHKAALEIDEEGAEATAVTIISIVSRKGYKLNFDRPFVYFIRDMKSGVILFMGHITEL